MLHTGRGNWQIPELREETNSVEEDVINTKLGNPYTFGKRRPKRINGSAMLTQYDTKFSFDKRSRRYTSFSVPTLQNMKKANQKSAPEHRRGRKHSRRVSTLQRIAAPKNSTSFIMKKHKNTTAICMRTPYGHILRSTPRGSPSLQTTPATEGKLDPKSIEKVSLPGLCLDIFGSMQGLIVPATSRSFDDDTSSSDASADDAVNGYFLVRHDENEMTSCRRENRHPTLICVLEGL